MKIPYQVLNDLISYALTKDHEIGGCFNFSNGRFLGYTLSHGTRDSIDIPLDNCTISFHSHPLHFNHLGYSLDPPSPEDMKDTIGKGRNYILLTNEGVYEYGSISSRFRTCDYLFLYELIHRNAEISQEEEESILRCIEYHHGIEEADILLQRLSFIDSEEEYLLFVDYLFRLMGSYLRFVPYPLTEDFSLEAATEEDDFDAAAERASKS